MREYAAQADYYPAMDFEDPAIDACYGDLCYVDRADPSRVVRYWRAGEFRSGRFENGWMPPHPTFFVRRGIYEQFGPYREDLGTAADYELMLRMQGQRTRLLPEWSGLGPSWTSWLVPLRSMPYR